MRAVFLVLGKVPCLTDSNISIKLSAFRRAVAQDLPVAALNFTCEQDCLKHLSKKNKAQPKIHASFAITLYATWLCSLHPTLYSGG